MEKTSSNKLSNQEYEALIAKAFEGSLVKEKTIVTGKVVSIENHRSQRENEHLIKDCLRPEQCSEFR